MRQSAAFAQSLSGKAQLNSHTRGHGSPNFEANFALLQSVHTPTEHTSRNPSASCRVTPWAPNIACRHSPGTEHCVASLPGHPALRDVTPWSPSIARCHSLSTKHCVASLPGHQALRGVTPWTSSIARCDSLVTKHCAMSLPGHRALRGVTPWAPSIARGHSLDIQHHTKSFHERSQTAQSFSEHATVSHNGRHVTNSLPEGKSHGLRVVWWPMSHRGSSGNRGNDWMAYWS